MPGCLRFKRLRKQRRKNGKERERIDVNIDGERKVASSLNQLLESNEIKFFKNKDDYCIMAVRAIVNLFWQWTKEKELKVREGI